MRRVRTCLANTVPPGERRRYGIEFEFEGAPPGFVAPTGWETLGDGSLRDSGVEFRSQNPWLLETVETRARSLYELAMNHGLITNVRTGIHVHVNCQDYTIEQVGGILATYCIVEPLLFVLCGDSREQNNYCVPWYRAYDDAQKYASLLKSPTRSARETVRSTCKYSALYLEPLSRFGTIEFRQAPTWDTLEQFMEWMRVIDRIVAYGSEREAKDVLDAYVSQSCQEWLESVFHDDLPILTDGVPGMVEDFLDRYDSVYGAEILAGVNDPAPWPATPQPIGAEPQHGEDSFGEPLSDEASAALLNTIRRVRTRHETVPATQPQGD